ncbi:MAG: hypothetical protein ACI9QC_000628 [Oceanicoccus sp.]|jgi:uncharacterized protein
MMNKIVKYLTVCGLALIALAPLASAELIIPAPPEGYVLDEANVLSESTESELETQLSQLELDTSVEITVVTVSSLQGYNIEEMSLQIGRKWGVGQEEFDNGVVFLIAPNERETRIEVGRGLEGAIPDAKAWLILDEVVLPNFAEGNFDEGVIEGTYYILNLAYDENFDLSELEKSQQDDVMSVFSAFGIFLIWLVLSFMSQSKSWWAGGIFGAIIAIILSLAVFQILFAILAGLLLDYILSTFFYKKLTSKGGIFGGGGGSSSGGGFGGGGFGGGGASGRW